MTRSHAPTRFIDLPRRKRRSRFVSARWKAKKDTYGQGLFYTHIVLPDDPSWEGHSPGHAEVRFVSKTKAREGWWYHADIQSIPLAVICDLSDQIAQRLHDTFESLGLSHNDVYGQWEKLPCGAFRAGPTPRLEALDNKTHWELELEEWEKVSVKDYAHIKQGFRLNFDCAGAVDLFATVPETLINATAICNIIDRFQESGEHAHEEEIDFSLYENDINQLISHTKASLHSVAMRASEKIA